MIKSPERKFLHDIASPIGTALFWVDLMLDPNNSSGEVRKHLESIRDSLMASKALIEERRKHLIEQEAKTPKAA